MEPSKDDSTIDSKTKILSEMDQERYESVIIDVNGKLDDLLDDLKKVDKTQVEVNKKIQEYDEKNLNFLGDLRNHLNQTDQTISRLNKHVAIANEDRAKQTEVVETFDELEKKYTEMGEQLTTDIEKLEKELKELIIFYGKHEDLSTKIEEHKTQMEVQEAQHKEKIDLYKKYSVSQQDILNEVFEKKLKEMSSQYQDQYQICTAGYSERKLNELKEKEANEKDFANKEDFANEEDEEELANEKGFSDGKDGKELTDETDME